MAKNLPTIRPDPFLPKHPDDGDKVWENKFFVKSESSNKLYTVSQNIKGRFWGCNCAAWITRRKCKHLRGIGLPENKIPYEAKLSA